MQGWRHDATIGIRGTFEVDSFHATPIDIMLKPENVAGDRSPSPRCRCPCFFMYRFFVSIISQNQVGSPVIITIYLLMSALYAVTLFVIICDKLTRLNIGRLSGSGDQMCRECY